MENIDGIQTIEKIVDVIARTCHEANRAYCQSLGDDSQKPWDDAPEWQKESARNGVLFHLNGDHGPEASHESWLAEKRAQGWKYGPVKDPEAKEHPCFVPYSELPPEQKAKDYIFRAIVHALGKRDC
ncbi:RyR domain-containing protein [Enterobacter bugandensis]|uniref:RyR domain-containing protein n=1 Tax=Enterobacter bugandensis TaxID=881260 RepID=UPI000A405B35|nr:RyR domain-containing protein [Enterobacter bugandensis]